MRRAFLFILSLLFASATLAARDMADLRQQLAQLETELNEALFRGDAAAIARIWAEDFVFIAPNGRVFTRAERLAGLRPPDPSAPQLLSTIDDLTIRSHEGVALVIVKSTWRGAVDGKSFVDAYIATHYWVREQSTWKLSVAQVTQVSQRKQ